MRASFLGVPESNQNLTRPAVARPASPPSLSGSPDLNLSMGEVLPGGAFPSAPWEMTIDDATLKEVAVPGSALASFLETNKAEIEEHEACIRELKAERVERIREALNAHGPAVKKALPSDSNELAVSVFGESEHLSQLSEAQEIDCTTYGTTAAAVAALQRGFLLVSFASCGTELGIHLNENMGPPSATTPTKLCGTTTLNGVSTVFEGSIRLSELKGMGTLRLVAAAS